MYVVTVLLYYPSFQPLITESLVLVIRALSSDTSAGGLARKLDDASADGLASSSGSAKEAAF